MINFYHRFVPSAAKLMAPLYRAIANNNKILQWSDSLQTSFTQAKQALANATLLHYPKSNAPTTVTVDASDVAIGAVLEQFTDGAWQPLAFFSRRLANRKSNTALSIVNCLLFISPFVISVIF